MLTKREDETPDKDFLKQINPNSLTICQAKGEQAFAATKPEDHFQFLRQGYFVTDKDSTENHIVMNRIVGLRDSWAKMQKKG